MVQSAGLSLPSTWREELENNAGSGGTIIWIQKLRKPPGQKKKIELFIKHTRDWETDGQKLRSCCLEGNDREQPPLERKETAGVKMGGGQTLSFVSIWTNRKYAKSQVLLLINLYMWTSAKPSQMTKVVYVVFEVVWCWKNFRFWFKEKNFPGAEET